MKILFYGEAHVPGSGGWCYAETLREMGHEVIPFDANTGFEVYGSNHWARVWRRVGNRVLERHRRHHVRDLVAQVERGRPDVIMVSKGLYLGPQDVLTLRASGAWVVNINHDDFFSTNRNNWSPMQRSAIPAYDYVFVTREINVQEVRPLNANVEFLPFAYFPRIHRPPQLEGTTDREWEVDVVFVGTWEAERARVLEALVRHVPATYAIWGTQWEKLSKRSPLRPFLKGRPVVMEEMAKAIAGAKIALGFLRKENRDEYTQRTFEIPACGGVLVAERTAQHQRFFVEGHEAEFFDPNSASELIEKVQRLLTDPPYREGVRAAGHQAVRRQRHTYRDRLERVLELYAIKHNGERGKMPEALTGSVHTIKGDAACPSSTTGPSPR